MFPLEPLLLVLFVLFRALCAWLSYKLGIALFRDDATGLATAAALSAQTLTFADDIVSDFYLTHGALAQAMTLACLLLLARRRFVWCFAMAGLMYAVHAMHATHLVPVLGLALLVAPKRKQYIKSLAVGAVVVVVLMAPVLLWMKQVGTLGAVIPDGYVDAIRAWFPIHFWPSTWTLLDWTTLLAPVSLMWPCWRLTQFANTAGGVAAEEAKESRVLLGLVVVISLVAGFGGGLVTELVPHPFLVRLHPMRLSWIMMLAGAPFVAHAAVFLWRRKEAALSSTGATLMLALGLTLFLRHTYLLVQAPALVLAVLWMEGRQSTRWRLLLLLSLLLAVFLPFAIDLGEDLDMTTVPGMHKATHGLLVVVCLYCVSSVGSVAFAWFWPVVPRRVVHGLSSTVLALALTSHAYSIYFGTMATHAKTWRETQEWSAAHIAPGENVMVPLAQIGFRAFSKQTPAVDFQEGDALFHSPMYMQTFLDKLKLYGWTPAPVHGFSFLKRLMNLDEKLSADDAVRIAQALHAHYAVRDRWMPGWALPVVFQNDGFVVYDVSSSTAGSPSAVSPAAVSPSAGSPGAPHGPTDGE